MIALLSRTINFLFFVSVLLSMTGLGYVAYKICVAELPIIVKLASVGFSGLIAFGLISLVLGGIRAEV